VTVPRAVRATLIAPLVVPLLYLMGSVTAALADPSGSANRSLLVGVWVIVVIAAVVAYAATLALALPLLWLVRWMWRLTLTTTVAVGVIVGTGLAAARPPQAHDDLLIVPLPIWGAALLGAAAGAMWWWLARPQDQS
jgi:hypothetical protein